MFQSQFVITEKCNLACKYCYMNNRSEYMEKDIFENSFNFIENKLKPLMLASDQITQVAFFGGEPILNLKLIHEVLPLIKENPKNLPTNGLLLTQEIYQDLIDNNIGVSISYDGKIGNSINRITKINNNPSNSYFKEYHFEIMRQRGCKVMLNPSMFPYLVQTYYYFLNRNILWPDFTLVRDDIYAEQDIKIFDNSLSELTNSIIENYKTKKILAIPGLYTLYILDTIVTTKTKQKRPFGCFAGTHGVGIMPNGKIYPCARFGSNDLFQIADTSTGTINHDVLEFFRSIHNPQDYPECKQCKLYKVCNAGCSFSQLKNGNNTRMKPVESVCSLLRICYREAYELYKVLKDEEPYINYLNHKLRNAN